MRQVNLNVRLYAKQKSNLIWPNQTYCKYHHHQKKIFYKNNLNQTPEISQFYLALFLIQFLLLYLSQNL